MKRILGIAVVLGLMGALTMMVGCSKAKIPQSKEEPAPGKVGSASTKKDNAGEPAQKDSPDMEAVIGKSASVTQSLSRAPKDSPDIEAVIGKSASVTQSLSRAPKDSPDMEAVIGVEKGIKVEMVLIPAGKFVMGSPASEKGHRVNETQHEVTITKPFYMGKYEVTQEQWEEVMVNHRSFYRGPKLPVTSVSWEECQEFIEKLNAKTSGGYRLPTEAEWEYSCRAGTTTAYSYGDSITKNDSNVEGLSTKAVGSYKPNAFGLYDMHGNVWEWCEDWKVDYPKEAVIDPKGPEIGKFRVLRGGSFTGVGMHSRSANWFDNLPSTWNIDYLGFRLAKTK